MNEKTLYQAKQVIDNEIIKISVADENARTKNRFGISPFIVGDIIDKNNVPSVVITAINSALSIVRIKRDRIGNKGKTPERIKKAFDDLKTARNNAVNAEIVYRGKQTEENRQNAEKALLRYAELIPNAENARIETDAKTAKNADKGNTTIFQYLNNLDAVLRYAWNNVDEYGNITCFDGNITIFARDYIADGITAIIEHNGETITTEILKQIRNRIGTNINDENNHADSELNHAVLDERITTAKINDNKPIYNVNDIQNAELKKAFETANLSAFDIDIVLRISNGEKQIDIADEYGVSNVAIYKRYHKALETLKTIMKKA